MDLCGFCGFPNSWILRLVIKTNPLRCGVHPDPISNLPHRSPCAQVSNPFSRRLLTQCPTLSLRIWALNWGRSRILFSCHSNKSTNIYQNRHTHTHGCWWWEVSLFLSLCPKWDHERSIETYFLAWKNRLIWGSGVQPIPFFCRCRALITSDDFRQGAFQPCRWSAVQGSRIWIVDDPCPRYWNQSGYCIRVT